MPIKAPAIYEFFIKKKKKHHFIKKKSKKEKPYGWRSITLKEIETQVQSILNKYNTRKNNKKTWDKVKKEVQEYLNYLWDLDHHGFSSKEEFAIVHCEYNKTMQVDDLINNRLILSILINLDNTTSETQTYISIVQQQIV